MDNLTVEACSHCGCFGDQDQIFTTGDPVDPYICIDCIEKAEERRTRDLADAFHRTRVR